MIRSAISIRRLTYEINHQASVRLARLAKQAGVSRFVFSSSCSLYGAAGDDFLDENASFNPVTAYGESKVLVEQDVSPASRRAFQPTFLRNATAYGVSPRLRGDLVVNNLVGYAYTTGEVLIKSDGSPWRPLVHIRDIAAAFIAVLQAPRDAGPQRVLQCRPDRRELPHSRSRRHGSAGGTGRTGHLCRPAAVRTCVVTVSTAAR